MENDNHIQGHWQRFRRWFLPLFIAYFVDGFLLRLILATCKVEIHGLQGLFKSAEAGPCMLACWHNRLPICTYAIRRWAPHLPFGAIVSKSGDGQILTTIVQKLPNMSIIRVPHDARHQALRQIIHSLKEDKRVLLVTPDGPRGPRYRSKPGTVVAAEATDAVVIPASWSATRFLQLGSWDKMMIPLPFSKIHIHLGDPLGFGEKTSLKVKRQQLDDMLTSNDAIACGKIHTDVNKWPV
ncbi:MAG: DUF374 domain-containing protein [Chlamydiales bacterium]|nr:DUF374 domain-containing protein [Chlamydiales bacterium]